VEIEIEGTKYTLEKIKKKQFTSCKQIAGDDQQYLVDLMLIESIASPKVTYDMLENLDMNMYLKLMTAFNNLNGLKELSTGFTKA